jgi:hypothetical protein
LPFTMISNIVPCFDARAKSSLLATSKSVFVSNL